MGGTDPTKGRHWFFKAKEPGLEPAPLPLRPDTQPLDHHGASTCCSLALREAARGFGQRGLLPAGFFEFTGPFTSSGDGDSSDDTVTSSRQGSRSLWAVWCQAMRPPYPKLLPRARTSGQVA